MKAELALAAMAVCVISMPAAGQPGRLSLESSIEYASGDYGGTETVNDLYVPVTGTYRTARFAFRATVPYVRVADSFGTDGGFGDVVATFTAYDVARVSSGVSLDVTGGIKFGTADESVGLGTGKNDYSVRADLYKFMDRGALFGGIGYSVRGDPRGLDLSNAWVASLGGGYRLSPVTYGGVSFDYRQSSIPGADSLREVTAFLSRRVGGDSRIGGYVTAGFGDSVPGWSAGLSFASYVSVGDRQR
jgi:hypothetical protein